MSADPFSGLFDSVAWMDPPDSLPLRLLGLERLPATRQDITQAFRRQLIRAHPDIAPELAFKIRRREASVQELVWARSVLHRKVPETASVMRADERFGMRYIERRPGAIAAMLKARLTPHGEVARPGVFERLIDQESRRTGLICATCYRDIGLAEPIFRGLVSSSCKDCQGDLVPKTRPCEGCRRPVRDGRSRARRLFCTDRCAARTAARNRRHRRRALRPACPSCKRFLKTTLRKGARYCSSACRQKAYRKRAKT